MGDNVVVKCEAGKLIAAIIDGFPIFYGGTKPYLPDPKTGLAVATDEWASCWFTNSLLQKTLQCYSELSELLFSIDCEMGAHLQEKHESIIQLASQVPGVVGAFLQLEFGNGDPKITIANLADTCYVVETVQGSIFISPSEFQYHESLNMATFQFFKKKNGGDSKLAWLDYNRNFHHQLRDIDVNNPDIPHGFGAINGQSLLQHKNIEGYQKRNFKSFFKPIYFSLSDVKRVLMLTDGGIGNAHLGINEDLARGLISLAESTTDFHQMILHNREYVEHYQENLEEGCSKGLPEATYLELRRIDI